MEVKVFFAPTDNSSSESELITIQTFQGLPFPLNLSPIWKILITILLLIISVTGLWLRRVILTFSRQPSKKVNPINVLIWIEQLIGLSTLFTISFGIVALNLSYPVRETMGEGFCHGIQFPVNIYLTGTIIWSCLTAIYRVLYIRAQARYSQN
jgi:hypothetical protein